MTPPTPLPRRGRPRDPGRAARRREQILARAGEFFARRGYAGTDLDELAAAIGVGKGTVYRHFPTKEALFFAAVDRVMETLVREVNAGAAKEADPLARIATAIRLHLRWFDRHPDAAELLIQERASFHDRPDLSYYVHRDANLEPWRAMLRGLIAARRIRRIPVDRIVNVVSDFLYGAILTSRFARRRRSLAARTEDLLDIVFRGLLPGRRGE